MHPENLGLEDTNVDSIFEIIDKNTQTLENAVKGPDCSTKSYKLPLPRDLDEPNEGEVKSFAFSQVLQDPGCPKLVTVVTETKTEESQPNSNSPSDKGFSNRYRYCKEVIKPFIQDFPPNSPNSKELLLRDGVVKANAEFPESPPSFERPKPCPVLTCLSPPCPPPCPPPKCPPRCPPPRCPPPRCPPPKCPPQCPLKNHLKICCGEEGPTICKECTRATCPSYTCPNPYRPPPCPTCPPPCPPCPPPCPPPRPPRCPPRCPPPKCPSPCPPRCPPRCPPPKCPSPCPPRCPPRCPPPKCPSPCPPRCPPPCPPPKCPSPCPPRCPPPCPPPKCPSPCPPRCPSPCPPPKCPSPCPPRCPPPCPPPKCPSPCPPKCPPPCPPPKCPSPCPPRCPPPCPPPKCPSPCPPRCPPPCPPPKCPSPCPPRCPSPCPPRCPPPCPPPKCPSPCPPRCPPPCPPPKCPSPCPPRCPPPCPPPKCPSPCPPRCPPPCPPPKCPPPCPLPCPRPCYKKDPDPNPCCSEPCPPKSSVEKLLRTLKRFSGETIVCKCCNMTRPPPSPCPPPKGPPPKCPPPQCPPPQCPPPQCPPPQCPPPQCPSPCPPPQCPPPQCPPPQCPPPQCPPPQCPPPCPPPCSPCPPCPPCPGLTIERKQPPGCDVETRSERKFLCPSECPNSKANSKTKLASPRKQASNTQCVCTDEAKVQSAIDAHHETLATLKCAVTDLVCKAYKSTQDAATIIVCESAKQLEKMKKSASSLSSDSLPPKDKPPCSTSPKKVSNTRSGTSLRRLSIVNLDTSDIEDVEDKDKPCPEKSETNNNQQSKNPLGFIFDKVESAVSMISDSLVFELPKPLKPRTYNDSSSKYDVPTPPPPKPASPTDVENVMYPAGTSQLFSTIKDKIWSMFTEDDKTSASSRRSSTATLATDSDEDLMTRIID